MKKDYFEICFLGPNICDINEEIDDFRRSHNVISIVYKLYNKEFWMADIKYN